MDTEYVTFIREFDDATLKAQLACDSDRGPIENALDSLFDNFTSDCWRLHTMIQIRPMVFLFVFERKGFTNEQPR